MRKQKRTEQGAVPCLALFFVQFAFCKVQIAPRSEPEKSKTAQKNRFY